MKTVEFDIEQILNTKWFNGLFPGGFRPNDKATLPNKEAVNTPYT